MNRLAAQLYSFAIGLAGVGALLAWTDATIFQHTLALALFAGLSLLIKRLGFHVFEENTTRGQALSARKRSPEVTHSLVGVIDLAALLVYGPIVGGWVAVLSEFTYLMVRRQPQSRDVTRRIVKRSETAIFNAGLKALMALAGGWAYTALGGMHPPWDHSLGMVIPLGALFLTWFGLDHLGWTVRVTLHSGSEGLAHFLRGVMLPSLFVELAPLPFSVLIAAVYTDLDYAMFLLLAGALIAASFTVQRLADTQRRLRARVEELSLLADLGREVQEAPIDTGALCELAHRYAGRFLDTSNFKLELLDHENNTVQQAMCIQDGRPQQVVTVPVSDATAWMQRCRQPLLVQRRNHETPPVCDPGMQSGLYVPLLATGNFIGLIAVQSPRLEAFTQGELQLLSSVASTLAVAIENAQLYERALRRATQLATISEVSHQVAAILNLEELLQQVVELIHTRFHYDHVQIFTLNHDGREAVFRASNSPIASVWRSENHRLRVGEDGIIGWVAAQGAPLLVNDVSQEPRYILDKQGSLYQTRAELAVPLKVEDRVLGVLDVQSNRLNAFSEEDLFVLQTLADQVAVAIEDARLYEQTLQQEQLQRELELARVIQTSLLPAAPPKTAEWDIGVWWQPARNVAGDFYDFIALPDSRWGILIADVSDKGVPAALFMALARTLIRTMALDKRTPARALERANDVLLNDARADMFVTAFYGVLDPAAATFTYTNAGHLPPLVYRCREQSIASLRSGGIALGVIPAIELEQHTITLDLGDLLVLYTDGITEAINAAQEEFGEERLARLVAGRHAASAEELVEAIATALTHFTGDQPAFDDQALVIVKRAHVWR